MALKKIKIVKDTYTTKFMLFLAASCLLICFLYIFLITFVQIPKENQRYADLCLGFLLGTFMATIIQFFFGSSNSSRVKDEALQSVTNDYHENINKLQTISDIKDVLSDTVEDSNAEGDTDDTAAAATDITITADITATAGPKPDKK